MITFNFFKNYFSSFYSYVWSWVNYLFGRESVQTIQTNKTKVSDVIEVPKVKKEEEDKQILKYLFPSFDFTKESSFAKSDEMVSLLNKNITDLNSAREISDKVFYFSRISNFPIYGIKQVMKDQIEELIKEQKDELLLAILKNLEWEFAEPFFVRLFYSSKIFYYKLMFGRPLLEKIHIYKDYEVEIDGKKEKRIVYNDVTAFFMAVGRNEKESVNIRADCLDAVLTFCSELKKEATEAINSMGQLYIDNKDQTIYTNSQNVHTDSITMSCVSSFKNLLDYHVPDGNLDEIYQMILLRLNDFPEKREKVISSLKRIIVDPSHLFGFTLSEILSVVWKEMERKKKYKEELEARLIEELYESDDTCTSGFFTRVINILSGFTPAVRIRISEEDEAVAKIVARIKKEMATLTAEDKERLSMDMVCSDEEEGENSLRKTLRSKLYDSIHEEEAFKELKTVLKEKFEEILEKRLDAYFGK
jgi:hypothetical protein